MTLAIATYAHIAASFVLFGAALFPLYARVAPPKRVLRWSALAAFIFGVCATALHAIAFETTLPNLMLTGIGRVWFAQCGLAVALVLGSTRLPRIAFAMIAGINVALFAFIGHANAIAGWPGAGVEALHLLAAGGWIGGLVALVLSLRQTPSAETVRRFSWAGMVFVVVLAASGVATLFQITGAPLPMTAFSYGLLAWAKVSAFAIAAGLASFNRVVATPRNAWRALAISIALELVVLSAALALAVRFASTEPLA